MPIPTKIKPVRSALPVILALFGLMALAYSLLLPLGEAADEAEHFALIRFITEQRRLPLTEAEQHTISSKGDASPLYHTTVALLTQHVDVSTLPHLLDPRHLPRRAIPADRLPIKGLYHTADESWPFTGIVLAWHLARLPSIPLALLTLTGIYATIRLIFPRRPGLALSATVIAAFIPRFILSSAIVSDDNLVVPLTVWALYFMVRLILQKQWPTRGQLVGLGALLGLSAMAKYHSLILLGEAGLLILGLAWAYRRPWKQWLTSVAWLLSGFLLTAGWWFTWLFWQFNQVEKLGWLRGLLYPLGDPVITGGAGQVTNSTSLNLGYETALGRLEWLILLFKTFWFRFGRGHTIDNLPVNLALALLLLLAATGLIRLWQRTKPHRFSPRLAALSLLGLHLLSYAGLILIRYLALPTRETAQGRHFFPALTAIALLLALGLPGLFPPDAVKKRLVRSALFSAPALLFILSAITLPVFVLPVYRPYLPIHTSPPFQLEHPSPRNLTDDITLLGQTRPAAPVTAGQALPLTLYWQTDTFLSRDYLVELCLHDETNQPVTCQARQPVDGRYPMRAWEPGSVIRDEVQLPTPACAAPGAYRLSLSLHPLRPDTAAAKIDSAGPSVEPVSLGQLRLTAADPAAAPPPLTVWANQRAARGPLSLSQLRQALTVFDYGEGQTAPLQIEPTWAPALPPTVYRCPGGPTVTTHHYLVSAAVRPGRYQLQPNGPTLEVQTRPRQFNPPPTLVSPLQARLGDDLTLLSYNLPTAARKPGEKVNIAVQWQTRQTMNRRYVASFHLLDAALTMQGQIDHVLGNDFEYPNLLWTPGEVISQRFALPVDSDAPPGLYTVEFGVYHQDFGDFTFLPITTPDQPEPRERINLGRLRVLDPAHADPPPIPLDATVGPAITLTGYELQPETPRPGQPLELTLYWQTRGTPVEDYTVFTQLLGPDGRVWSQRDNPPQQGRYPTSVWAAADRIVDRYHLELPADAPPGDYHLLTGMYRWPGGERLPAATAEGVPYPNNAIRLITLTLPPE